MALYAYYIYVSHLNPNTILSCSMRMWLRSGSTCVTMIARIDTAKPTYNDRMCPH